MEVSAGVNRGVNRVLAKLEDSMKAGNFYEAHQMYRTLYFRYLGMKKYDELLELLHDGAVRLLSTREFGSASDLVDLLIEVLEKSKNDAYESWIKKIAALIKQIDSEVIQREALIVKSIKWSSEGNTNKSCGHPLMHKLIADIYWSENNYEQARQQYLLSKDGVAFGNMLIELSEKKAFPSELDLLIAQVVLQLLCLKEKETALLTFNTYIKLHPRISTTEPPLITPLLNFIYFLLKLLEDPKAAMFKTLCELYKPSLDRDPSYEKQIQTIGTFYFKMQEKKEMPAGGLFGELFNQIFQGLDSDDEDLASNERNVDLD